MEMSHRSKPYEAVHNEAIATMKELLGLGDDYEVLFLQGGASSQFSMIPLNLLTEGKTADYILTGSFAEKAHKEAKLIGKTHVAVTLIQQWQQQGLRVAAMKPVASGAWQDEQGIWRNDDVERLIAATGQTDRALLNPYCFPSPISPHLAAREAGVQIDLKHLVDCYRQLAAQADVVVVEGAGEIGRAHV